MLIEYDKNNYVIERHEHVCDFHKKNPGKQYAGCTCFACIKQVRKQHKQPHQGVYHGKTIFNR